MARRISTPAHASQIKPTNLVGFHRTLAKWYKTHGRHDLPWRNTTDPYHIWLSEVMLQQTQVSTVRDRFYGPFLTKFPTIEALAAAPSESVMKAWEGLGYYSRARNLHKAAKMIMIEGGLTPYASLTPAASGSPEATHPLFDRLVALPGIGRNTASAILAFAYHQPVAILEANVKRVVARIFALETPTDNALWARAESLLNRKHPFDYNQAMMDIGSMVCTPKNPRCETCPANIICQGKTAPQRYPTPKARKHTPTREVIIHVREDARGRLFLEKRDEKLLSGLYGFPQTACTSSKKKRVAFHFSAEACRAKEDGELRAAGVSAQHEGGKEPPSIIGLVTHIYSHFKLIGHVVYETAHSKPNSPDWHSREEISQLPLSKLDHKVLALVENCHNDKKKSTKAAPRRQAR